MPSKTVNVWWLWALSYLSCMSSSVSFNHGYHAIAQFRFCSAALSRLVSHSCFLVLQAVFVNLSPSVHFLF